MLQKFNKNILISMAQLKQCAIIYNINCIGGYTNV